MFMTTNFFIMLAIVVYLAIMLVIGFVYPASVTTVQKISILAAVRWDLS